MYSEEGRVAGELFNYKKKWGVGEAGVGGMFLKKVLWGSEFFGFLNSSVELRNTCVPLVCFNPLPLPGH